MSNPFHLANLIVPTLDGIVRALSDGGIQTEAERLAKANAALTAILAFLPRDVIEMTLAGQTILFNELLADGAHDVLGGMVDAVKRRSHANLLSMGRVVQGHLDRLERRGNQPHRIEAGAAQGEALAILGLREADAAEKRPLPLALSPPSGANLWTCLAAAAPLAVRAALPDRTDTGGGMPSGEPPAETSWLDEPYEQWLIETYADLAARGGGVSPMKTPAPRQPTDHVHGGGPARIGLKPDAVEPTLPRRPSGYSHARSRVGAASANGD